MTAIEMLSSEQIFYGCSPPAGFLTDYSAPVRRPAKLTTRGFSAPSLSVLKPIQLSLKTAPRSCIRLTTEKKQKRVVFADDRGFALEHVKVMTEPSHVPPYWALKIIASPPMERRNIIDAWEIRFVQPASDYLEFRRRVTENCVALENVIVKQSIGAVDGTVKVKNLDFVKEVLVRATSDGWRTHEDTYCEFIDTGSLSGVSVYDTFGFRLQLPIHSRRLEFCVCFRCNDREYWDSREGENFTIEKSSVRKLTGVTCARINYGNSWSRCDAGMTPYW